MIELSLTDEQALAIRDADSLVPVLDSGGNVIGHIVPLANREGIRSTWTDAELREAKRSAQSQGPWRTTQEVLARLAELDSN